MRELLDVALERTQQRRVGLLPPTTPTAVLEHPPPASLPPADGFGEEPRLTDTGLTGQQQQWWSFAGKVAIEQEEFMSASDEPRSRGSYRPRLPRAKGERPVIQVSACRFEALALMRCKVQCFRQEGDCIPPWRTRHAPLDVCEPTDAEMCALSKFLLRQSSNKAMTSEQGSNASRY
jgi:hypothetical protein